MDLYLIYPFLDSYFIIKSYEEFDEIIRYSCSKKEYIKKNYEEGLLRYTGVFYFGNDLCIKLHRTGILLTSTKDFVALVKIMDEEKIDFKKSFKELKKTIFKKLEILEVLKDESLERLIEGYDRLMKYLVIESKRSVEDLVWADNCFQLSRVLKKWRGNTKRRQHPNFGVLKDFVLNDHISGELRNIFRSLLEMEKKLFLRNINVKNFNRAINGKCSQSGLNLIDNLEGFYKKAVINHRESLLDKCLYPQIKSDINNLPDDQIFFVQNQDITLFIDLVNTMKKEIFSDYFDRLQNDLFQKVRNVKNQVSIKHVAPLSCSNYYFICKSFQEIIIDICRKENVGFNELICMEQGKLDVTKLLDNSQDCILRRQCEIIFRLMEDFQPGKFRVTNELDRSQYLNYKNVWYDEIGPIGYFDSDTPEERLVWLCIFRYVISHHINKKYVISFLPLIEDYIKFIGSTETSRYESFRVVTYNIINFLTEIKIDISIKNEHLKLFPFVTFINQHIKAEQFMTNDFRDFRDISNEYLEIRNLIIKFTNKLTEIGFQTEVRKKLLGLINFQINGTIEFHVLFNYLKTFREFFIDLDAIQLDWLIKNNDFDLYNHLMKEDVIEMVDNELPDDKKTYLVLNNQKFIGILKAYEKVIPRHYVIDIIEILLSVLHDVFVGNEKSFGDIERINVTNELLSAIRGSFLYYKEQADYPSFDVFKKESTDPFIFVIKTSDSYHDTMKRINILKDAFWYLRKQEKIDLNQALNLYKKLNETVDTHQLEISYNKYLQKFNYYVYKTIDMNHEDKIRFIVDQIRVEHMNVQEWGNDFRSRVVPSLLAGFSAVWSIQKSKDIENTGKLLKPHCIQILCVLRLLSVDKPIQGVEKHLCQVLTGQGKSLILALLSAVLAITDHRVRIVCYSHYLADRDKTDFKQFYEQFQIHDKIIYGTFDGMSNEIIQNEQGNLKKLVAYQILDQNIELNNNLPTQDINNTILLIDEVDVFFSDQYYGTTYNPCCLIKIPALVKIQERIWKYIQNGQDNCTIRDDIQKYIENEIKNGNKSFLEFSYFENRTQKYFLLTDNDNETLKKEYTNQLFWQEHLDLMIDTAKTVFKSNQNTWFINEFKIIDDIIQYKNKGTYSINNYHGYYNVFIYFKLKVKDFDFKDYQNYGYFIINCGYISYAKLPEKYPLILGVSGTLTGLNDSEKRVIKGHYNINHISNMPSFFGCSKLQFDPTKDFSCYDSEEKWITQIFHHANSMIELGRSVLIFFETDTQITNFQTKFDSKFNRLNILTGNSDNKDFLITQAGVTKTLTLLTREMGRGVDFKSSVSVEENGGMHVIQTFFSLDVKEETQIRGRTARKDNKGTFEIIVCNDHLIKDELVDINETSVDYQRLNEKRIIKMRKKVDEMSIKIANSEQKHRESMKYYQDLLNLSNSS